MTVPACRFCRAPLTQDFVDLGLQPLANSYLTRAQLDSLLAQYGLPPILQVYDSQVDVDGVSTRVTDDLKVIFVPPDPGTNLGYTAWGVSATSLELVNSPKAEMTFSDAPGIVGAVNKSDQPPFTETVYVDAVGMPVIENPNALMVATVASDDESSSSSSSS